MIEAIAHPWFVLKTKSRQENIVEGNLKRKNINMYLPRLKEFRRRKDRRVLLNLPLFPGYVFVQPGPHQFEHLRFIPGSCGLVLVGNEPAKMSEKELEGVRIMTRSGAKLSVNTELIPGKRVEVLSGPFNGLQGELVEIRKRKRLLINAHLLGKSVNVEINSEIIKTLD